MIRNSIRRSHAATAMRDVCLNGNLVVLNLRIRFCHSVEKQASCTLNKMLISLNTTSELNSEPNAIVMTFEFNDILLQYMLPLIYSKQENR